MAAVAERRSGSSTVRGTARQPALSGALKSPGLDGRRAPAFDPTAQLDSKKASKAALKLKSIQQGTVKQSLSMNLAGVPCDNTDQRFLTAASNGYATSIGVARW